MVRYKNPNPIKNKHLKMKAQYIKMKQIKLKLKARDIINDILCKSYPNVVFNENAIETLVDHI